MAAKTTTRKAKKSKSAKRAAPRAARKASRPARKAAPASRPARKASASAPPARKIRQGFISHTELASSDPAATKTWAESVLGWKFIEPMPTPQGPYHMWSFGDNMGGGIRAHNPPEAPGSIPYVEVNDIQATYDRAIRAGAHPMMPPEQIPGGMGWIAIVQAPGGPAVGFWAK